MNKPVEVSKTLVGETMKGVELLEQRLADKSTSEGGVRFDPMSIITMILSLFGSCSKPTVSSLRRKPLNVIRVRAELRKQGMSWADAREQGEKLFEVVDEASDKEVQDFIDECCK